MTHPVSIITTCRGRLHHLKQTLPAMLAQQAEQVIVVDYGCPDGTGDWVASHHPAATVVRGEDARGFCAARARNLGAAQARGDWLAFVDADNIVQPGWLAWVAERFSGGRYFVIEEDGVKPDSTGALVCRASDFHLAGRYDEAIRGWGAEDSDLRVRLSSLGPKLLRFPSALMQPIPHGDESRQTIGGLSLSQIKRRNDLFLRAKEAVSRAFGGLDKCCREAMIEAISDVVRKSQQKKTRAYYPLRFHRYCAACAEKKSANTELVLHRKPKWFLRPKTYVLTQTHR